MVTNWPGDRRSCFAIAIGINQYHFFQPLSYAQQDAQSLQDFLVEQAGFPRDHCWLLTDSSPPIRGRATYPTQENIQYWLDECQKLVNPGDIVWCFFSGYGVCFQGQDYLMPINSNPAEVTTTGIPVRSLLAGFKKIAPDTTFVLLDINRSPGTQSGGVTGAQTIDLSRNMGIATLLSCQPGEFSHESAALHQGFFTAALLEGLRYHQCKTLAKIDQYLSQRLPQLNDHHWRPIQHPVLVVDSPARLQQVILPQVVVGVGGPPNSLEERALAAPQNHLLEHYEAGTSNGRTATAQRNGSATAMSAKKPQDEPELAWQETATTSIIPPTLHSSLLSQLVGNPNFSASGAIDELPANPAINSAETHTVADSRMPQTQKPLQNGKIPDRLLELTADRQTELRSSKSGILAEPRESVKPITEGSSNPSTMTLPEQKLAQNDLAPPVEEEIEMEDAVFWRRLLLWGGIAAAILLIGAFLRNEAVFMAPSRVNVLETATTGVKAAHEVIRTLPPIPVPSPSPLPITSPKPTPKPDAQALNQVLLDEARVLIRPNQAFLFNRAIERAYQIKPGQPLYNQAQQDIKRWSQVILDLAEGRALQRNYEAAIAAAQLVPKHQPEVYIEAQQAIKRWRQQIQQPQSTPNVLAAAERFIQLGSASSYNRAIGVARQIKPSDSQYSQAQTLISEWSKMILEMAQRRADRGSLRTAIRTAELVPKEASVYPAAQQAIARWQQRLNSR